MTAKKKDLLTTYREAQKKKREYKRKVLGLEEGESLNQRSYTEATKTRRAVKAQIWGNKGKQTDTSIEIFVEEILKENDIKYIKQKAIRYLNYDFFLPEKNIAIECEGEYYHCDPRVYPNGPKNRLQREAIEKNKNKQEICKSQDIPLIRIHEHDIKKDAPKTKKQLLDFITVLSGSEFEIKNSDYEAKDE